MANVTTSNDIMQRVCLATASPAKFTEAVTSAGLVPVVSDSLDSLNSKPTRYQDWERDEDWCENLRNYIEKITETRRQLLA